MWKSRNFQFTDLANLSDLEKTECVNKHDILKLDYDELMATNGLNLVDIYCMKQLVAEIASKPSLNKCDDYVLVLEEVRRILINAKCLADFSNLAKQLKAKFSIPQILSLIRVGRRKLRLVVSSYMIEEGKIAAKHAENETVSTTKKRKVSKQPVKKIAAELDLTLPNVKYEFLTEQLGLAGCDFGNYQDQRQIMINNTANAFVILSELFYIPLNALSLGGKLKLVWGGLGSSKANAHYQSTNQVINFTKTHGAGCLAHEWFHGFDHFLYEVYRVLSKREAYGPNMYLLSEININSMTIPKFKDLYDSYNALNNEIFKSYKFINAVRQYGPYWRSRCEILARSFECFISDSLEEESITCDYLVSGVKPEIEISGESVYPQGHERKQINLKFAKLMKEYSLVASQLHELVLNS
jgi:hypothetical protein